MYSPMYSVASIRLRSGEYVIEYDEKRYGCPVYLEFKYGLSIGKEYSDCRSRQFSEYSAIQCSKT